MRLVSYTRVTSCIPNVKLTGKDISEQNQRIQTYAEAHGWVIVAKYSDRKNDPKECSGFQRLWQDGVRRCFDAVIIDSMFRAGNDLYYGRDVLVGFFHAGIHFIIVEDDRCSMHMTAEQVLAYMKEKERQRMSLIGAYQRNQSLTQGKLKKHDIPFGLRWDEKGMLAPDPETAPIVQRVFAMVEQGKTVTEITKIFREEHVSVLLPKQKNQNREAWEQQWERENIYSILRDTAYIGYWQKNSLGKKIDFYNEPIISLELFSRVQEKLRTLGGGPRHNSFSLIRYMVETECEDTFIKHCTVQGKDYFELVQIPEHQTQRLLLAMSDLEDQYRERLKEEKQKAELIFQKMQEEGETILKRYEEEERELLLHNSFRIADSEANRIKAYQEYKAGKMTKEEWNQIDNDARMLVKRLEDTFFAGYEDRITRMRIVISVDNPWLKTFLNIDPQKKIDRYSMKKTLSKIILRRMKVVSIELREQEWYAQLPEEWRKEYGAEE